jgi:hypothetical protein
MDIVHKHSTCTCSKCWQKICERRRFTISEHSCEFPQISYTVLYEIITVGLCYHKFCATWVPKMLTGAHKTLWFLERYDKDGDEFLSHIVRVTGDETWVLYLNVETKEQSAVKAVDAHTYTKQDENFKQSLSARQLMATVFWDRKLVLIVEFMQRGITVTSEVYCETLK